jgi:uncharacterized protein (DUF1499 family)
MLLRILIVLFVSVAIATEGPKEAAPLLKPCPDKPNCVISLDENSSHFMPALAYTGSLQSARKKIKDVVLGMPRTQLIKEEPHYLHFTFTSRILGFVDDVEFAFEKDAKVIHFRSASRVGYSDLGANRKRMEAISAGFLKEAP